MYGILYLITNKLDGTRYVGQTTSSLDDRWKSHCNKKSNCTYLSNAIQKHGKENFSIRILAKATSKVELDNREKYYIKLFKTRYPKGYNLLDGGSNGQHSEITKEKLSKITTLQFNDPKNKLTALIKNGDRIPVRCNETGKNYLSMNEAARDMNFPDYGGIRRNILGKTENYRGFTFSLTSKEQDSQNINIAMLVPADIPFKNKKISKITLLEKRMSGPKNIFIFCHQNKKVYPTVTEASRDLGLRSASKIADYIHGRRSYPYGGYTFSRATDEQVRSFLREIKLNPISALPNIETRLSRKERALLSPTIRPVLCHQNGIIYESMNEAARSLKLKSKSKICDVVNGKIKSYNGYTFSEIIKEKQ